MAPEIRRLTQQFLTNPVEVAVAPPSSTVKLVEQRLAATGRDPWEKRDTLRRLLAEAADLKNAIIFCNRKRDVATLARSLARHGFNAGALHGDMDQRARMAMLDSFRKGQLALLVASDVAARGLDIPEVSHIFNFDVPTHAEDYVHRIGRTGRAGRSGTAITLATPADSKYVGAIERLTGDRIAWMGAPLATGAVDTVEPRPGGREGGRRRGGRRGGTGQGRGNDTGTAGQRNNGANGAGHDRSANGGHREPQAVETRPAPQQAAARPRKAGGDRPAPARPGNTQKRNGRDRQDAPDLNALPAFLLRPVRPAKSAPE
jgi:superfamily II DNA/RNA helicase